ncbi:S66 peptidase family protein [Paenibacillus sp. Y412MC10]|uniref:S66 family peptidase n=1 Tax=Geobacillus sp. (strain Y412MC10) TaxID=481743 RepID=UPI0011AB7F0A|nr:S66 peptidase family protein [Paenibacillus sp. Y412MC10]
MIQYPRMEKGAVVGVTAPSSGIEPGLHDMFRTAVSRMEERGYRVRVGETVWTQHKAKSAPAKVRAEELNEMLGDPRIGAIIPPWGGELLIEMLDRVDFDRIPRKWILGYSDLSVLLLAITLKTGIATAHGLNFVDLRGAYSDDTSAMWETVLTAEPGDRIAQQASANYQKEWRHDDPSPCVFHLTEPTVWKTVSGGPESLQGRLLGGCVDVIRHLIGTPYGDVATFRERHIPGEPLLWYLENCELNTADLRRSLVQMKYAGWFEGCSGLLFGRSAANRPMEGYTVEDVYQELSEELGVPVIYDIDCGHVPPQMTLVNGAYAEVKADGGGGTLVQYFK